MSDRGGVEYSGPTSVKTFETPAIKSYVYPNPNATRQIQLNNLNNNEEFHIYNILGEELMKGELISGLNQIDLNFEAKGIFFIRLDKEQAIQVVLR
ncbi:MAG: T9SS type A sorting domain-containing protein [Bacteroidia bacterium]